MTTLSFTYYAIPLPDRRHAVHLYVSQKDPTWDDTPRNERLAIQDAALIVRDLMYENDVTTEERLLKSGEPPPSAFPVFMFAIGINWNRAAKCAHYSRVCYQRYATEGKWNPVAALGMEQLDYTMSVLRKREKTELKRR